MTKNMLAVRAIQHVVAAPTLGLWATLAMLATLTGPFGTYITLEWIPRTEFWVAVCGMAVLTDFVVRDLVARTGIERYSVGFETLCVLAMTLVFSPIAYLLTWVSPKPVFAFTDYSVSIPLFVFLLSVAVAALRRIQFQLYRQPEAPAAQEPNELPMDMPDVPEDDKALPGSFLLGDEPAMPETDGPKAAVEDCRLMRRLPAGTEGPILHLQAQDHMVKIEMVTETVLLRMRFSDAVREMDGVLGHNTHRSHWVAEMAIASADTQAAKPFLTLINGTTVPVSRTYQPTLERAGLLGAG
ncbi:MAG: LytTR family transcriptional regulator [Thalassovita sp.]